MIILNSLFVSIWEVIVHMSRASLLMTKGIVANMASWELITVLCDTYTCCSSSRLSFWFNFYRKLSDSIILTFLKFIKCCWSVPFNVCILIFNSSQVVIHRFLTIPWSINMRGSLVLNQMWLIVSWKFKATTTFSFIRSSYLTSNKFWLNDLICRCMAHISISTCSDWSWALMWLSSLFRHHRLLLSFWRWNDIGVSALVITLCCWLTITTSWTMFHVFGHDIVDWCLVIN